MMRFVCFAIALALVPNFSLASEWTKDSLPAIKKNVDDGKAVLVDVREKVEWDTGHVEGAILLPLSELQKEVKAQAARLPKDKIIYTHCVIGKRSVTAGDMLEELGYQVRPLRPGYKELIEAGFPKAKK